MKNLIGQLSLAKRLMVATIAPAALMVMVMLLLLPAVADSRIGGSKYRSITDQQSVLNAAGLPSLSVVSAQAAVGDLYVATYLAGDGDQARLKAGRDRIARAKAAYTTAAAQLGEQNPPEAVHGDQVTRLIDSGSAYFVEVATLDALLAGRAPEAEAHVQYAKVGAAFSENQNHAASLTERVRATISSVETSAGFGVLIGVLAGAIVAASLAAGAVFIARRAVGSLLNPIGQLTRQAEIAANVELPRVVAEVNNLASGLAVPRVAPFPDFTGTEFAAFSSALNAMQDTAINLAVSQAKLRRNMSESLVNLGRRNQGLLARTLSFITELEEHERDPETLDDLYRLDHLTTRMRRNAESLLVLAGSEPPRTWSEPVPVGDVLRAALSEIESYDRVDLGRLEAAFVKGTTVSDLAHLLSELIENSTNFSPPTSRVRVEGRGSSEGYEFYIIDNGIGMTYEEMDEANRLLAEPTTLEAAPSKVLGHYVVSQLAERHGVAVSLAPSGETGGVTARIVVPMALLAEGPPVVAAPSAPQPSPPYQQPQGPTQYQPRQYQPQPQRHYQQPAPAPVYAAEVPGFEARPVGSSSGGVGAGGLVQRVRAAPEQAAAAPPAPPAPPGYQTEAGLPHRSRGSAWTDPMDGLAATSPTAERDPAAVRSALSAFQQREGQSSDAPVGAGRVAITAAGLPQRSPGGTWAQPEIGQQLSAEDRMRTPDSVRSSLAAFQAATRSADEERGA